MMLGFKLRRRWPVEVPEADDFSITGLQSSLLAFSINLEHKRDSTNTSNCFSSQEHGELRDKLMNVRDQARLNYRIASNRWEAARHAFEGAGSTQKILAELSPAQMNSYRLLREWWDNESYDSHITSLLRDWIGKASSLHLDIQVRPRITSSRYNYLCFCLWCGEFGVHAALSDVQLYDDRQSAAGEAARHRIAMQVVHVPEQLGISKRIQQLRRISTSSLLLFVLINRSMRFVFFVKMKKQDYVSFGMCITFSLPHLAVASC